MDFKKALQYHQSGQLQKAEEIYRKILELNPEHSDSLHLLGVIANQVGNNDMAVRLIGRAIGINPKEAISCYRKSLQIMLNFGIEVKIALLFPLIFEPKKSIKIKRAKLTKRIESLIKNNLILKDPNKEVGTTSFYLACHGLNNKITAVKML